VLHLKTILNKISHNIQQPLELLERKMYLIFAEPL
jgi:hypothetical protein